MIPTPDLSHLTGRDFDKVYEPAEDTFLLLDALEQDEKTIQAKKPTICLEIGSGSGCVTTMLAKIVGASNAGTACGCRCKRNSQRYACQVTQRTGRHNNVLNIESIQTSLVESLLPRFSRAIDILCFNPPYAVTPPEEVGSHGIEAAWAGGIDGRQVIDELLPFVPQLLSPQGIFYLLLINENRPTEVAEIMHTQYGMQAEIMMERRAGRERQYILKIQRSS